MSDLRKIVVKIYFQRSKFRDGGKPGFFQNPGSGSNPGFEMENPGFPIPDIYLKTGVKIFSKIYYLGRFL